MASCGRPQPSFGGYAFVANREGASVAVVDLGAFAVVKRIPVEGRPAAVLTHPTLPFAYALTPESGTLHELNLERMVRTRGVKLPGPVSGLRLSPEGDALFTLTPGGLAEVRLDKFRPGRQVRLPSPPAGFDLHSDGWAAVTLPDKGKVALIDRKTMRVAQWMTAGAGPGIVRFRPDGRQVLAGNRFDRTLSFLDVQTGQLVVHVPLAMEAEEFCFKADGGVLFVTGAGMDAVVVVYPYRHQVAETILAGSSPGAMAASGGSPEYLFVANPQTGDVTIIRILTSKVEAVVAVGPDPRQIVLTPDNQAALVLSPRSGDMAVIRVAALGEERQRPAPPPLFTMIPVGSEPVSAAVRLTI